MKICVITLGCPKNIVDSEYLAARLFDKQIRFVDRADQADVVIINTCAFILPAREEAIETILEAVQLKTDGKVQRVYVTGCLPQRHIEELNNEIPEVDGFFDQRDFAEIGKKLAHDLGLKKSGEKSRRVLQTPSHYAYLKISEGCDNRCHYCTIPIIKGKYRDRPANDLIAEAYELANQGVRELILVAQDTTYYGWKRGRKKSLCELIESLAAIEPILWIRLLYAHPAHVDDCLIELYHRQEKLCRYIDLPIQHISDKILQSMGRQVSGDQIRKLIDRLRDNVPDIAIRTTLMVGYPGERDTDFELLKEFVSNTKFERLGAFKYYAEDETISAQLPDQVDEKIKDERLEEIMELQAEIARENNQQLVGRISPVIIDELNETKSSYIGRTQWDSPQIDNIVHVTGDVECGNIYPVKIETVAEYEMWGKPDRSRV